MLFAYVNWGRWLALAVSPSSHSHTYNAVNLSGGATAGASGATNQTVGLTTGSTSLSISGAPGVGTLDVGGTIGLGTLAVGGAPGVGTLAVGGAVGPGGTIPDDVVPYLVAGRCGINAGVSRFLLDRSVLRRRPIWEDIDGDSLRQSDHRQRHCH